MQHPIWTVTRTRPELVKELDAMTRRNLPAFKMTFAPYIPLSPPAIKRLGDVRVPTLVLIGDRDTPDNRRAAELAAKEIRGATLRVIAGADHGLPLGWSAEFNEAVMEFLAKVKP
jgi:pimeloyl-ACP methyl ester carboxylesterase